MPSSEVELSPREIEAAIKALMPIVRREAAARKRKLPANVELDDLLQAGRMAAWEAVQKFDGRGSIRAYAVQLVRQRMTDYLRGIYPAGHNGPAVHFVSDEQAFDQLPADDDQAQQVEDRETMDRQLQALSPKLRSVAIETLAGKSGEDIAASRGVTGSRVSQMVAEAVAECSSGKAERRTHASFDPVAVPLYRNVPVPPVRRPSKGKFQRLIDLMSPGDSRVLANSVAASLVAQMKRCGVRYCVRRVSDTTRQVWREPTAPD